MGQTNVVNKSFDYLPFGVVELGQGHGHQVRWREKGRPGRPNWMARARWRRLRGSEEVPALYWSIYLPARGVCRHCLLPLVP
jgi:hypothetical protein